MAIIAGSVASGYKNGVGTVAIFSNPIQLAISTSGTIYVVDSSNNMIRSVNLNGKVFQLPMTTLVLFCNCFAQVLSRPRWLVVAVLD
jgi:hypothetical protein